jgi:multiple sugar transport system ATP-binding protein
MGRIVLENVSKSFGNTEVIPPLSLTIEDGEFAVFVGPSGCGKSTLLRLIAGLEEVSGGSIQIDGSAVTDVPPAKRGLAMVFQSYALYPQMTVRGNLTFGLKNAKVAKAEIEKRVARAAEILQIEPLLNRKPGALSGGQRQRVAIGRALVRDVDVFLFDEPLSNLDAKLRVDLRVELKRLHNQLQNTMIYVTHDQIEAMTLADRIAVMKGGAIMQLGTPDEIYNKPKNLYVADFIGSPAMNLMEGDLVKGSFKGGDLDLPLIGYEFADPQTADRPVVIGLRPEHLITGELAASAPVQMTVPVDLVEGMGADTLVYATLNGQAFRIRMDGQADVKAGQDLAIGIDPARASLFDKKSENRL